MSDFKMYLLTGVSTRRLRGTAGTTGIFCV